jgi:hypothetical protein
VPDGAPGALRWIPSADAEERCIKSAGDDAERSDAEERRISPGPVSSAG